MTGDGTHMGRIKDSIEIAAPPQRIWDYVQDYRRRAEWDATVARFEPVGTDRVDKGVTVRIRSAGFPAVEYEAVYVSYEPYTVSAVKLTRPIKNDLFRNAAGSWRYQALDSGGTLFTMTFDYDLSWGIFGVIFDRLFLLPVMRAEIKRSLKNLQQHFSVDRG